VCVYVCVCLCACVCVYMCMRERERTHNVPAASAAAARTPILRLSIFRNLRIASIHPTINDVRTKSEDSDVPDFSRTPATAASVFLKLFSLLGKEQSFLSGPIIKFCFCFSFWCWWWICRRCCEAPLDIWGA